LTIDTVMAFELVKPDGQSVNVTQASDPELFFGLKVSQLTIFFASLFKMFLQQGRVEQLCT